MKDWHLEEQDFPSYTPIGTFQTSTGYFIKNKKYFQVVTRCQVINEQAQKNEAIK